MCLSRVLVCSSPPPPRRRGGRSGFQSHQPTVACFRSYGPPSELGLFRQPKPNPVSTSPVSVLRKPRKFVGVKDCDLPSGQKGHLQSPRCPSEQERTARGEQEPQPWQLVKKSDGDVRRGVLNAAYRERSVAGRQFFKQKAAGCFNCHCVAQCSCGREYQKEGGSAGILLLGI
jgi:hypothetical protein